MPHAHACRADVVRLRRAPCVFDIVGRYACRSLYYVIAVRACYDTRGAAGERRAIPGTRRPARRRARVRGACGQAQSAQNTAPFDASANISGNGTPTANGCYADLSSSKLLGVWSEKRQQKPEMKMMKSMRLIMYAVRSVGVVYRYEPPLSST